MGGGCSEKCQPTRNMKVINLLEVLGDSVKTEEIVEGMQEEEHEHEDAEEHEHEEEADEHVWLSLKNAKMLVRVISKALQELDPNNKRAPMPPMPMLM